MLQQERLVLRPNRPNFQKELPIRTFFTVKLISNDDAAFRRKFTNIFWVLSLSA
jgi:hypothetical protein